MNEEAVKDFLSHALSRIPHGKLKKRIVKELTEHIEDNYYEYIDSGLNEDEATSKVIKAMGDADEIGCQLYRAHRSQIVFIRIFRAVMSIAIVFALFITVPHVCSEVYTYFIADTISEAEEKISGQYNDGKEIVFVGEYEYSGVVTRLYLPKTPSSRYKYFYAKSIKFFNISIPGKITEYGSASYNGNPAILMLFGEDGQFDTRSQIDIFFKDPGYKYMRVWIDNIGINSCPDASPTGEWSKFYEVPSEYPGVMRIDTPKGKHWSCYRLYDENKQEIKNINSDKE